MGRASIALGTALAILFACGTASADDESSVVGRGPQAGSWVMDLRLVPVGISAPDLNPQIELFGAALGVGKRISRDVYLGGSVEYGLVMDANSANVNSLMRLGVEGRYIFHTSTAEASTDGEETWSTVPWTNWLGVRLGPETPDWGTHYGAFGEAAYGGDAWLGSFQFGLMVIGGIAIDPKGEYGYPSLINSYAQFAFHMALDL